MFQCHVWLPGDIWVYHHFPPKGDFTGRILAYFSPFSKIISHYYSNPQKKRKVSYSTILVGITNFYLFGGFSMFFPQHILVLPVALWIIPPPPPRRSLDRRSSARSPDQRNPMGQTRLTFVETRYEFRICQISMPTISRFSWDSWTT